MLLETQPLTKAEDSLLFTGWSADLSPGVDGCCHFKASPCDRRQWLRYNTIVAHQNEAVREATDEDFKALVNTHFRNATGLHSCQQDGRLIEDVHRIETLQSLFDSLRANVAVHSLQQSDGIDKFDNLVPQSTEGNDDCWISSAIIIDATLQKQIFD